MQSLRYFVFCLYFCYGGFVLAQTPEAELQGKLSAIQTIEATFTQTVATEQGITAKTEGHLLIKRPNRFVWESFRAPKQFIVADGRYVWVYDQDLAQVTVKPISKSMDTPAAFFNGTIEKRLSSYYQVQATQIGTGVVYTLTPKSARNPPFRYIQIRMERGTFIAMRFLDHLGQTTDLRLKNVQTNRAIPDSRFVFISPPGIDVIRQ